MSECVVCGLTLPEGCDMVCNACCQKEGLALDTVSMENENSRLRMLLSIERGLHASIKRKFEKAKHDRERYAKRIKYMDERHTLLCALYRAEKKERETLEKALQFCESSLLRKEKINEKSESQN